MIALLLSSTAALAEPQNWWGVGPMIGTTGFPVQYPAVMPALAQNNDGDNLVEPVTFDLRVGAHAVYYIGNGGRIGSRAFYAGNFATWGAQEITLEYDVVLTKADKFQLLGGGGIGFGHDRFGALPEANNPDAYLDVTYFPLRAQLSGLFRNGSRAYELQIFGTWHIAGEQKFSLTGEAGDEETGTAVSDPFADLSGADAVKSDAALYAAIGAEVTVYFGDFKSAGKSNDNDNDNDGGKSKSKGKGKNKGDGNDGDGDNDKNKGGDGDKNKSGDGDGKKDSKND